MTSRSNVKRHSVVIVGAFPPPENNIFGGIVRDCQTILNSSFAKEFNLSLVDSTQISNPPPGVFVRAILTVPRLFRYLYKVTVNRPDAVIIFTSGFASVMEKGIMGWIA